MPIMTNLSETLCEQLLALHSDLISLNISCKKGSPGIYRKAYKQNAVRGRSTRGLSVASVFYACKEAGIIRNPEDFVADC